MDQRDGGISTVAETVKVAPPAVIATAHILGYSLSDWLILTSLIYTLILLYVLVRDKIYVPYKRRKGYEKNTRK
jgi:hypothetical protein